MNATWYLKQRITHRRVETCSPLINTTTVVYSNHNLTTIPFPLQLIDIINAVPVTVLQPLIGTGVVLPASTAVYVACQRLYDIMSIAAPGSEEEKAAAELVIAVKPTTATPGMCPSSPHGVQETCSRCSVESIQITQQLDRILGAIAGLQGDMTAVKADVMIVKAKQAQAESIVSRIAGRQQNPPVLGQLTICRPPIALSSRRA